MTIGQMFRYLLISVLFLVTISLIALTAGAHRLYAHRTFAAVWQLRLFVMLSHTLAGVVSTKIYVLKYLYYIDI